MRALAAATFVAAVMVLAIFVVLPLVFLVTQGLPGGSLTGLAIVVVGLTVMAGAMFGLNFLYVRVLSALATGAKGPITVLLVVVMVGTLLIGWWTFSERSARITEVLSGSFPLARSSSTSRRRRARRWSMELRRATPRRELCSQSRAPELARSPKSQGCCSCLMSAPSGEGRKRAWAFVVLSL